MTTWAIEKWKRKRGQKVKPVTVNRELTILKDMLKMRVKWELTSSNPAASVSPDPVQAGRIRYLAEPKILSLLEACENKLLPPGFTPL